MTGEGEEREVQCDLPEVGYGIRGTGPQSAAITLSVTDDCEIVVKSIEIGVEVPDRLADAMRSEARKGVGAEAQNKKVVKRQTGGWHDHMDVVRLLLTESYAHIKYRDDGKKVSNASGQLTYCYNARDGWFGTGSLTDWSQTNKTVWIWKRCSFSFIGGSFKHDLDVDVYSWPGNDWEVFCTRRGQTVPGAKFECGKAHKKL